MAAFLALYGRGAKALPAIREGLKHADWQIRRWSAMFVDNFADSSRSDISSIAHFMILGLGSVMRWEYQAGCSEPGESTAIAIERPRRRVDEPGRQALLRASL